MTPAKNRRAQILERLELQGEVRIKELSEELQCSEVTIRSDIQELAAEGNLHRTHGGAVLNNNELNISFSTGEYLSHREEKSRIAQKAYEYINNRDSIIIDDSTSCYYLAKVIRKNTDKKIIVVTNSLITAAELSSAKHVELFVLSGHVVGMPPAMLDTFTIEALKQFNVSKAFIGVNGINLQKGLASLGAIQRDVKMAILRAADELYVLADHTKFEGGRLFSICDMSAVNRIITDSGVPDHIRKVGRELYLPIDYV